MVDPIKFGPLRPVEHRKSASVPTTESKAALAPSLPAPAMPAMPAVSLSKLTAMARELADSGPPVDHARIAQIRQAIAMGSYRIDPDAIAGAMLHHYDRGTP